MARKPKPPGNQPHRLHVVRGGYELLAGGGGAPAFSMAGRAWTPAADVCEAPDHLLILLEVAGIDPGELSLYQRDLMLVVQGQRRHDSEAAACSYERVEIATGHFEKVFYFADFLDLSQVQARYQQGILRLRIAKTTMPPREAIFLKIRLQEIT